MAVRVVLTSGERRVLPEADGAHIDGIFFLITRATDTPRQRVVVTLSAQHVILAEIVRDGEVVDYVAGAGRAQNDR